MKKISNLLTKMKFYFKKNTWISLSCRISKKTVLEGYNRIFSKANVESSYIGIGSYIGKGTFLPKTKVGRFCTIAPDVKLISGKHPAHDFVSIHPAFYSTRKQAGFTFVERTKFAEFSEKEYSVEIGNDVWIGSDVIILEGVKIGDGAIIGSGAIVSKDIDPYSINVGNPIKEIGKRFESKEIDKLLELKWWNKDIDWIRANSEKFENLDNLFKKS